MSLVHMEFGLNFFGPRKQSLPLHYPGGYFLNFFFRNKGNHLFIAENLILSSANFRVRHYFVILTQPMESSGT